MTNAQCGHCHRESFSDFAWGHPEFNNYPPSHATRLTFSHATHEDKYFPEAKQAYQCDRCHDRRGEESLRAGVRYDACSACHDAKLRTILADGIPFISLPTMDLEALRPLLRPDDHWPSSAQGAFDGAIPLWMQLLLAADPNAAEVLSSRGTNFDFLDLEPAAESDRQQALVVLRAIRTLGDEMSRDARECIQRRWTLAVGTPLTEVQIETLLQHLPQDLITDSFDEWFHDNERGLSNAKTLRRLVRTVQATDDDLLAEEEPSHDTMPTPGATPELDRPDPTSEHERHSDGDPKSLRSGWQRTQPGPGLLYLPQGHADPLVTGLLSLQPAMAASPTPLVRSIAQAIQGAPFARACGSCHFSPAGKAPVWTTIHADSSKALTKFAHRPHIIQPRLSDCRSCHRREDRLAATVNSGASAGPMQTAGHDFARMTKSTCVDCHREEHATDRCTLCHRYHLRRPTGPMAPFSTPVSRTARRRAIVPDRPNTKNEAVPRW